jgi:hypothetical protein
MAGRMGEVQASDERAALAHRQLRDGVEHDKTTTMCSRCRSCSFGAGVVRTGAPVTNGLQRLPRFTTRKRAQPGSPPPPQTHRRQSSQSSSSQLAPAAPAAPACRWGGGGGAAAGGAGAPRRLGGAGPASAGLMAAAAAAAAGGARYPAGASQSSECTVSLDLRLAASSAAAEPLQGPAAPPELPALLLPGPLPAPPLLKLPAGEPPAEAVLPRMRRRGAGGPPGRPPGGAPGGGTGRPGPPGAGAAGGRGTRPGAGGRRDGASAAPPEDPARLPGCRGGAPPPRPPWPLPDPGLEAALAEAGLLPGAGLAARGP